MSFYDVVFDRLIGSEGGYKADRADRGDWTSGVIGKGELKGTKWGISAMTYPNLDIKSLTKEQAKDIYKKDWWDKLKLDDKPNAVAYQLMDAAIQSGMHNAVEALQTALSVKVDGIIGAGTLAALAKADLNDTLLCFISARITFYTGISTWARNGAGWMNRVARNLLYAAGDN